MIDSVVIKLSKEQFTVLDYECFDGRETKQVDGKFFVTTAFCKKQMEISMRNGNYFPRISLPKNKQGDITKESTDTLEIQVSLPKLLYGTNIFDIDSSDLEPICLKLVNCLNTVHVQTTADNIKNGVLKRVDFSKVIRLPDYLGDSKQVLKNLADFNYKPSSDFTIKEFNDGSGGMALKFWNSTQGYVIYDKCGEIIANGHTNREQEIIKLINEQKIKRHIIKFELSLQRKQSLEAKLRPFIKGKKSDFTLSEVMTNKDISKTLLIEVFNKVYNNNAIALITLSQMAENQLERYLLNKNLSLKTHALLYYLVNMTTKIGVAEIWRQMKTRIKGGGYDKYKKEVSSIIAELEQIPGNIPNLVYYLRKQHEKFELYKP